MHSSTDNTDTTAATAEWTMPWSDSFIKQEETLWKNNLPLVLATSITTGIYSYTMIDKSTNNAVNRGLLMALSTFLGITTVDLFEANNLIDTSGNMPMVAETIVVPLIYYYINRRQFQFPDLQSQAITTAGISSVLGQLLAPHVDKWMKHS